MNALKLFAGALLASALIATCSKGGGITDPPPPPPEPSIKTFNITPRGDCTVSFELELENFNSAIHSYQVTVTPMPAEAPTGYPIPAISRANGVISIQWCRVIPGNLLQCLGGAQALRFRADVSYTITVTIYKNGSGTVVTQRSIAFSGAQTGG